MMPGRWRQGALFTTLAASIVFSFASHDGKESGEKRRPSHLASSGSPAKADARPAAAAPRLDLGSLEGRAEEGDARTEDAATDKSATAGNLFTAMSWYVPPPPAKPLPPPPPPPPTAPPVPFNFMGRYVEGKTLVFLLVKENRIYTVSPGDVIDNTYRIERLTGDTLELTYLPLHIKQTLNAG